MNIEPFFGPDDTLVHELFHKARMMRGTFCKAPTDDPYDNIEEFLSVLVTNIYLSEIGKNHRLRAGHSALIESLKLSSYDFFMKYDMRISILQREMDSFARFISTIDCGFNPIRDSYKFIEAMRNRTGMLDVTTPTF